MIYINKTSYNNVYVTLTEKTTITNPNYLLKLVSNDNLQEKVVRMEANQSNNTMRYDLFTLIENPLDDLEFGQVNLVAGMTYDYSFYQTSSVSGNTITSQDKIVETGVLKVRSTGSTINSVYTNTNTIKTFK